MAASFNKLTTAAFRHAIGPGMVVYDVGAGNGTMTAAAVAQEAMVYAIEAHPLNAANLRTKFASCPDVRVLEGAASDAEGWATLYAHQTLTHALWQPADGKDREPFRVPTIRLDDVSDVIPDVIKVDVQGWETRVVRGALDILRARQTCWVIEVWPEGLRDSGSSAEALCQLLEPWTTPLDANQQPTTWDAVREAAAHYLRKNKVYFDLWVMPQ